MERNVIRPLNKLLAAASHQLGCEVHSDCTGAVYLAVELFIHSAAGNTTGAPALPGPETVFVNPRGREGCSGRAGVLCTLTVCARSAGEAAGRGQSPVVGAKGPLSPQAAASPALGGLFPALPLPEPGSGDGLCLTEVADGG